MKEKLRHIFLVLTPGERRQFWVQIVLNVLISIADIASLAFLLLVINFYINNSTDRLSFLPEWMLDPGSIALISFFFVLFGIKNLLGIYLSSIEFKFVGRIAVRISQDNLIKYQEGMFEDFINIDSSSHISRIAYHPFDFCQHVLAGVQQIVTQAVLILFTIVAILVYNAQLFLFLLMVLLPPVIVVFFYIRKRLTNAKKNVQLSNERSHKYLFDALKGYVEGNVFQRNVFFENRFTGARKVFSKHLFDSISIQAMPARLIETFAMLGLFILIVIAKWSAFHNNSTLIMIGAFVAAAYKIIPGVVKIINAAGQMKAYEFSIREMEKLPGKTGTFEETGRIETLKVRGVNFNYGAACILNDFSLTLEKGTMVGITGRSGIGKTTIFNLLLGFLSPSAGEIFINGSSVAADDLKKFWPRISYVRQQPFFIHDSILRNITLRESNYSGEMLEHSLQISGLSDFIDKSPEGLDKMITENGKNISGGQQQRITIARALYKDADLILLDEPFNELDEASALLLTQHFKDMTRQGKTVVMITHDSKCLSFCDKIISLNGQR